MGWRALGDSAWLIEPGGGNSRECLARVLEWSRRIETRRIPELCDIVSSFETLAVHFSPEDGAAVLRGLLDVPLASEGPVDFPQGPVVEIPVAYDGEDLSYVAETLGLSPSEIIRLHSGAEYTVAAVGFSPGFPYLSGLPAALHIPRRKTPRSVPQGAVAIGGAQAGIYPFESQGGWHVLGRSELPVFDLHRGSPALLRPGDRVRFLPVGELPGKPDPQAPATRSSEAPLEILEAGPLSSIQDLGRSGHQRLGVSPGGAADPLAARVANRLVGNPDSAALIECCMQGPRLRFHHPVRVAAVGWGGNPSGRPIEIPAGGELDLRARTHTLRGYIAIAGGIDVPPVLGSRATDLRARLSGWQGRLLADGDRLPLGPPESGPQPGDWRVAWPHQEAPGRPIELRFLRGMQADWFPETTNEQFRSAVYHVSPVSDRTGARLEGPALERMGKHELVSQPVVAGSVQVPPDGQAIVLLAERQTIGGYPQIGHVISADLPKLARAWPGTRVRFREVTLEQARAAWRDQQRELRLLQAGLDFLR